MSRDLDLEMRLKSWRQFVQIFRCYVWSEERGKVVEFSPVSNQNISLSSNILSYWNMYWKSLNPIATKYWKLTNLRAMRRILVLPLERAPPPSWGRSAGEVSQGDISQLVVTNHHLWQEWEHEQPGLGRRGGREGQEDQGAGGHSQEAEGAHGDLAGGTAVFPPWSINHFYLFGFQRKMQLAEDNDQPNSLQESDEIPDLWTHFWQFGAKWGASQIDSCTFK